VRIATRLEFHYSVNEVQAAGFIEDFSEAGAWIDTQQPLPVDTEIEFRFDLPDEQSDVPVSGTAIVVREEPAVGMALEFRNLDNETRARIRFHVASIFFNREEGDGF
jgi:uncharacterized protein (TIGR02266 family)